MVTTGWGAMVPRSTWGAMMGGWRYHDGGGGGGGGVAGLARWRITGSLSIHVYK